MRLRRGLGHNALHFVPLVANQPRQHVDFVNRGIGDCHRGGVIRRNAVCAVRALNNHRCAELARINQLLDLLVAAVVAAHEADLYQMLAGCHFGIHNRLAVRCGIRQRLFAEHRLAGLNRCNDRVLVERARGGDDNGVNVRIVDGGIKVGVDLNVAARDLRALLRALFKYIAYGNYLRTADTVLNALDVFAANHAATDNCNFEFHEKYLHIILNL